MKLTLIEKIKLFFQLRGPGEELVTEIKEAKSGWKTPHFWVSLLLTLSTIAGVVAHILPATAGLIVVTAFVLIYQIARAIENAQMPGVQPLLLSTRFWMTILGLVGDALMALQTGGISTPWITTALGAIAAIGMQSQQSGAQQPPETAVPEVKS